MEGDSTALRVPEQVPLVLACCKAAMLAHMRTHTQIAMSTLKRATCFKSALCGKDTAQFSQIGELSWAYFVHRTRSLAPSM